MNLELAPTLKQETVLATFFHFLKLGPSLCGAQYDTFLLAHSIKDRNVRCAYLKACVDSMVELLFSDFLNLMAKWSRKDADVMRQVATIIGPYCFRPRDPNTIYVKEDQEHVEKVLFDLLDSAEEALPAPAACTKS
jgi:hypothetical protein